MSKIVRIDCGDCGVETSMGTNVARFTYADGGKSYIIAGAFPSEEEMISACNNNPFVQMIIETGKDSSTDEAEYAKLVKDWKQVWVDTDSASR